MLKFYNLFLFAIGLNKPIQFYSGLPNIITRLSNYINKNYIENPTNLHRWCHKQCDKYRDTCDWKSKLDNANKDNTF